MTLIDSLYFGLKREFWEHRRAVFWAPIGFSLIMLLGLVTINVVWGPTAEPSIEIGNQEQESGQIPKKDATTQQRQIERQQSRNPSRKSFAYLTLAWLVSVFYLLSALHSDRKDKSITFWKSLPVSETQNVIHKLVFAVL